MLAAGATIVGKAVCEDLCFSGGSHTSRTGAVRNPWDETRSAGGSSSGSAALVMAGIVDIATGGDQGSSVRIPSAYTGTVGHKPTYGLVPYTGAFPIEQTIDRDLAADSGATCTRRVSHSAGRRRSHRRSCSGARILDAAPLGRRVGRRVSLDAAAALE
jgi:Asp-tRNA(Asn)/Glu-tRNA(Gln) amidotransferase A subunit family amidase